MKNSIWPLLAVLVVAAVSGIAWYLYENPAPQAPPPPPKAAAPTAAPSHYPIGESVPTATPPKPLPALDDSDAAAQEALAGLIDPHALAGFFQLKNLIRRIVATVDNLPREKLSGRLSVLKPVPGSFIIAGTDAEPTLSSDNDARYAPYARLAQAVDAKRLVAVYTWLYPLFQQAYVDLGYPDGYFNDRLVQTIDNLLATPTPAAPVHLTRPKVLYLYADPELESLSSGQKVLLRMGPDQAAIVKNKLREIRAEVTSQVHRP